MLTADGGQTETASTEIRTADELKKLANASGAASFKLMNDIVTSETITLNNGSNITLYLNDCKIKHTSPSQPLFNITGGATLTVKDKEPTDDQPIGSPQTDQPIGSPQTLSDQGQNLTADNYGKKAELGYDSNDIPANLTYYVTESVANGTRTTETLKAYKANIQGAIVACGGDNAYGLKLVNLFDGGHFNLESGTLTQKQGDHVGNLIYAENGSTITMNGGYICGADTGDSGAGAGIKVSNCKGKRSTFKMTNGVIAGNSAPSGAGVFAEDYVNASDANNDNDSTRGKPTVEMTGGIITGNYTRDSVNGLGGGILVSGGSVTVSGGFITNNRVAKFCGHKGDGCHGGAGLAANNGAHVTISGGQITGNYSQEAGGGVYVTDLGRNGSRMAWLNITGGIIASNVSYQSEGAGIRVGQMVDAMINGPKESNGTKGSKVYITNDHCMSRFDWGGGGIFVQGDTKTASNAGRLFVYNSYISSNTAGGYGGGVAVCPSGKTLVTNTEGTAIFGNTDAKDAGSYDSDNNNGSPHLSGGGDHKDEDKVAYESFDKKHEHVFRNSGHADFFLAAKDHNTPVAVVTGKMLGDIDARYSGSIELTDRITIPANGVAQVKNSIGLTSGVSATDKTATEAVQKNATTFITGNYSWNHGGGIMSNGDLYLGQPADTYVYPSLKLKATKALKNQQTNQNMKFDKDKFSFSVYRKDSDDATEPSWNDKKFDNGGCTLVGTAKNDANGNITFDLGEQLIDKTVEAKKITYYLVENAGNDPDITYDSAVYKIVVTVQDHPTLLMNVPSRENPNSDVPLYVHNYTITSVSLGDSTNSLEKNDQGYYSIVGPDGGKTFTNKYAPYTFSGTWKPQVTKKVDGGEMKKFKFELANDENFTNPETVTVDPSKATTDENGNETVPVKFATKDYELKDLENGSKTFTYYVREKDKSSTYPHYKFDQSVYRFKVVATDNTKGNIDCVVTYRKGTVNSEGTWVDADTKDHKFADDSTPTFTNTYSTSLPLSGMSGVTLTYLAGAAVLCAAAAWMHIRRKANAKGGKRHE